jgi:hypothetical protein
MAYTVASPNTGTSVSAQINERNIWKKGVDIFEQSSDFFMDMEGEGVNSLIQTVTDTSKGVGQKIKFTVMSGLYDEPHIGEELFEAESDFETLLFNEYEMEVDYLRHGVSWSDRMEEYMGMRGEITAGIPEQLGNWLGRTKTERLFMMFKHKLNSENLVYANGKSQDTLVGADTLDWDEIIGMGVQLQRLGGRPAYVGRAGRQVIRKGCVVATTDALYSLETDTNYKQVLRETVSEANAKMIFDGGYTNVRGHVIRQYNPIDHDGQGAIGSPLNAKALLGTAITAGTGTFNITGGGSAAAGAITKKLYFKFFDGYAYRFLPSDVLSPASETRYVLIVNPPNAATDPNKIGMYAYTTGNDGNKITITQRLGSAAAGARVTTLGDVVWNTGVWAGKHTDVHPEGALVLPCNAKGQVFGDTLMLYAAAALRGYGKYRNMRSIEKKEGGDEGTKEFLRRIFVTSVFGQTPRKDRQLRCPGVLRLRHAIQYAGVPLPIVT